MALVMIFGGVFASLVGLVGYFLPAVRRAEERLPDHGQDPAGQDQPAEDSAVLEESMAGA
jgi:hypothetical protein